MDYDLAKAILSLPPEILSRMEQDGVPQKARQYLQELEAILTSEGLAKELEISIEEAAAMLAESEESPSQTEPSATRP
jgi:hypothetical protein